MVQLQSSNHSRNIQESRNIQKHDCLIFIFSITCPAKHVSKCLQNRVSCFQHLGSFAYRSLFYQFYPDDECTTIYAMLFRL